MSTIKASNGTGTVIKKKGNRRRPYAAIVTTGFELNGDKVRQVRKAIGYYRTQKEAREALAEYNKMNLEPQTLDITLDDIWQRLLPEKKATLSETRLACYRKAYERLEPIKKKIFRNLKTSDLQKIVDLCPTGSHAKKDIKIILTACYKYAMENDICPKDYSQFIKIEKDDVKIERHVLTDMVSRFEFGSFCPFNDIMLILLYTGARSKEILASSTVFDLESQTIEIHEAKNKTSVRVIPIHPHILEVVKRYTEEPHMNYQQLYRQAKEHGFTLHDTRHTFITRCHECGMDELVVQKLVGHAPQTITQAVYTHISIEEMRSELLKLHY